MKTTLTTMVAVLVGALTLCSTVAYGQSAASLSTGKSIGSADTGSAHGGQALTLLGFHKLSTSPYSGADVTAIAVRMPSKNSPGWHASAAHLIADLFSANGINMVPHELTTLGDYSVCAGKISTYNTVYSESTPLWKDILNPTGVWAGQLGETVQILLFAKSRDGKNSINLGRFYVLSASSDGSRLLSDRYSFGGTAYTDLAVGKTAEGRTIDAGTSADVQCATVAAIVQMKLFNGGASADVINQVHDYEVKSGNFTISYTVGVDGDASSQVTTSVSLNGPGQVTPFNVVITPNTAINGVTLTLGGANTGYSYQIQSSADLSTWGSVGTISGSGSYTEPTDNSKPKFYRAVVLQ